MKRGNGEGSIVKIGGRRTKPWSVRITIGWDENGKPIRRYIGYAETKKKAKELLNDYNLHPRSDKEFLSLKEIHAEWRSIYFQRDISDQTKNSYESGFNLWKPLYSKRIKDIKTADMQKVINSVKLSRSSKQKMKIVMNLIYKYAMENDIVTKNYAQYIHIDAKNNKTNDIITRDDIKKLIENDHIPYVDAILIMFFTGFRVSEFLNIKKENVDLKNKLIIGGGKTKAGTNRVVPIIPLIEGYVRKYYNASKTYLIERNGRRITDDYWRKKIYYKPFEELGIKRRTPHKARHTCGTIMAECGMDPLAIKSILGHTNYAFTADVYTHVDVEFLKKEMNKISTVAYTLPTN